ncbi:hypothetical protein [Nocardioides alcanivorans]|uniref:hypothetical protein n=1 Tax=Nocardioides alcanivorans TaxID=2897352 RepID=UPI001F343668|nr:hypothetical protein [Nocardioides alcanivorans]
MKPPVKGLRALALAPLLAVLALLVGFAPALVASTAHAAPVAASDDALVAKFREMQAATGQYILDNYEPSGLGLEWKALGLARNNTPGAEEWLSTYYENLVDDVVAKDGKLGAATEFERVILAVTAIGEDPSDVGGHNLLEGLADLDTMRLPNQRIFGLLALDSNNYEIPVVEGVVNPTTRQALVDLTLAAEINGGGWAFFGSTPDPDMTGMTMQALAPYKDQPAVAAALERGVTVLANIQKDSGAFASFGESVESTVQAIAALTPLGIDPATDPRFVKSGGSAAAAVTNFYIDGGGFWYNQPSTNRNSMSTEQGFYGIADYLRLVDGRNSLYDMTDVGEVPPTTPTPTPAKVAGTVKVEVKKAQVKRGKKAVFKVKVTAAGVKPTGNVRVVFAGRKVTARLNANGATKVKVKVTKAVKPGKKAVKVKYLGDAQVKKAVTKTKKVVKVKK